MRMTICKACVAFFLIVSLVRAVELDQIERKIGKLPEFSAKVE